MLFFNFSKEKIKVEVSFSIHNKKKRWKQRTVWLTVWLVLVLSWITQLKSGYNWHLVPHINPNANRMEAQNIVRIFESGKILVLKKVYSLSLRQGNVFTPVCHSVHRGVADPPGAPTPRANIPRSRLPWEQTSPGSRPPRSRHPPAQCMLEGTGNKWAIRILLECILVIDIRFLWFIVFFAVPVLTLLWH